MRGPTKLGSALLGGLGGFGVAALVRSWASYKRSVSRGATQLQPPPTSPHGLLGNPWDIGTGVVGLQWRTSDAKAAVLFLHGYGDHTQRWFTAASGLLSQLSRQRFDVYAFDMWGHGRSPGLPGVTDVDEAVADHLAARQRLRQQSLPVFLVAHSLGGLITLTSAIRDPSDIAGMVVVSPAIKYSLPRPVVWAAQLGGYLAPSKPGLVPAGRIDRLTHVPAAVEQMTNDPLFYAGRISWLTLGGGAFAAVDNWRHYPDLQMPLLAIHGTADQNTDPTGSAELVDAVSSLDRELLLIDGGWHALLDDSDGPEVVTRIITWLQRRVR